MINDDVFAPITILNMKNKLLKVCYAKVKIMCALWNKLKHLPAFFIHECENVHKRRDIYIYIDVIWKVIQRKYLSVDTEMKFRVKIVSLISMVNVSILYI